MKRNAFTLIELLVVVTIIALLAGLAVPAIGGALDKAKQTADVVNARQLGLLMFTLASDDNGNYPTGGLAQANDGTREDANSSTEFFNSLIVSRELTEPKLVWSSSAKPKEALSRSAPALAVENIAFEYVKGLTSNDFSGVPLFISRGAVGDLSDLTSAITLDGDNVWKTKGFVIYTVGNSAEWKKAAGDTVPALYDSTDVSLSSTVSLLSD